MRTLIGGALILVASHEVAGDTGFWLMGTPYGETSSPITGLSQDGRRACGICGIATEQETGFSWSVDGGRVDWGQSVEWYTRPYALSGDGSVTVGIMYESLPDYGKPFRRVGNGLPESIGLLPGTMMGFAWAVSGDGQTIAGRCDDDYGSTGQAFRWTLQAGMEALGHVSDDDHSGALGMSRDGKVIVGFSRKNQGSPRAFKWTETDGMIGLPQLPGSLKIDSTARATNADGSILAGGSQADNGRQHAVRWIGSAIEDLGVPQGYSDSTVSALDDTGDLAVGLCWGAGKGAAWIWRKDLGCMRFTDYLGLIGFDSPPGYELGGLDAVSGDGLTFAGEAYNTMTKKYEGFVVTIPAPSAGVLLLAPLAWRRRRGA